MTQRDRDRPVALQQAHQGQISQKQAAEHLQCTERQVRRLLQKLKSEGDKAVMHGLRGRASNRKRSEKDRDKIVRILSQEVYQGFGPTLAAEYLGSKHKVKIGREALRKIMTAAGLWQGRKRKVEQVHMWRPRHSSRGELVQWDTSDHDWLEGRGVERFYLIHMIDDATSELSARFVPHDSTEENTRLLKSYLETNGRPVLLHRQGEPVSNAPKIARDHRERAGEERDPLPPTQIGRALRELGIVWIAARELDAGRPCSRVESGSRQLAKPPGPIRSRRLRPSRCLQTRSRNFTVSTIKPSNPNAQGQGSGFRGQDVITANTSVNWLITLALQHAFPPDHWWSGGARLGKVRHHCAA